MQSLVIVAISLLCALLTSLSLSAIVTNGPAREGGTYFLISRALGPRIGGAVGFMYYLGVSLLAVLEVSVLGPITQSDGDNDLLLLEVHQSICYAVQYSSKCSFKASSERWLEVKRRHLGLKSSNTVNVLLIAVFK